MRRTARALSLAAATGAVLAALAPAACAGTVPDGRASWPTASPSPCPEPGHEWEGHTPQGTGPGAARPDAALEPADPEALVPDSGTLDESGTGLDDDLGTGLDDDLGTGAGIPAPDASTLGEPEALEPENPDPGAVAPAPGAMGHRAGEPKPTEPRPTPPKPRPTEPKPRPTPPKPVPSKSATPCPRPPAPVPQGVHAGAGGAFTDSVPALAAGGLLIAGAFGAAAHRLYRDRTTRAHG
ncbi:hypothetical protein ACI2LV_30580 [Streptomyces fungicidicus]|uniref:hypothetical protein n=1 Tax=Streptomyces fungicidicus TaxID=68203 RepID=UPI003850DA58